MHAAGNYVIVNKIHSIYYFCSFKQGAHEVRDFSLLVFADRLNHVRDQVLRDFSWSMEIVLYQTSLILHRCVSRLNSAD